MKWESDSVGEEYYSNKSLIGKSKAILPTIQDRARWYSIPFAKYPDSHFLISDRWVSATWILGNNYKSLSERGEDDKPFYGSYPPGFLKRVWSMFPDCKSVVHLFSGSLTKQSGRPPGGGEVLLLDRVQRTKDTILHNAEDDFSGLILDGADLILADPPYSVEDAEHYGPCLCNKKKVLIHCHTALKTGGYLLWMDQSLPQFSKKYWNWCGVITMIRSTNHRVRCVFIFEKVEPKIEESVV